MFNANDISIKKDTKIIEALNIIDKSSKQICLVIDQNNKLIGTVNDGDIRRGLLKNISIQDSVDKVFYQSPKVGYINDSKETILNLMKVNRIHQLPIVDSHNIVQGIEILDDIIIGDTRSNEVFLMAGGLGKRLRPLTENTPKPMLKVGGRPILQTIVEEFVNQGFKNIRMCVGYKSDVIENFFGDGSSFGANIRYIHEKKRLGTAGALSLIEENLDKPFFVMNGDLVTKVNFKHLLNFHNSNNAVASMCLRKYDFQVPYGVVKINKESIVKIEEKPVHNFFVNAGIYMLNPECLNLIPKNKYYDITSLFDDLINANKNVISFPLREYWLDIGISEEYKRANIEFNDVFNV
jgi:dTDP-glucose pyrophosphorylase/predicted transcriptional regulator